MNELHVWGGRQPDVDTDKPLLTLPFTGFSFVKPVVASENIQPS